MKILIIILFFLICGCSDNNNSSKTNKESTTYGYVTLLVSSKYNDVLYFQFSIGNITLINKDNKRINISGTGNYDIEFSRLDGRNDILLNMKVPAGIYHHISMDIDLSEASIKTSEPGIIGSPTLHDSSGINVNSEVSTYTIESNINGGIPLVVAPEETTALNIQLDIDASKAILAINNDNIDMLISPVFDISTPVNFPGSIDLVGTIHSINEKSISIYPHRANRDDQAPIQFSIDSNLPIDINGVNTSLIEFLGKEKENIYKGFIIASISNELEFVTKLHYFDQNNIFRLEGYITDDNQFVGAMTTLGLTENNTAFIEQAVKNVDKRDAPFYVKALTHTNNLDFTMFNIQPLNIYGEIVQDGVVNVEFQPFGINNLDPLLLLKSNTSITATNVNNLSVSDGSLFLQGIFSESIFTTKGVSYENKNNYRLTARLPLDGDTSLVNSIDNTGFNLNNTLSDEWLLQIQTENRFNSEAEDSNIEFIAIKPSPSSLIIRTERTTPSLQNYRFLNSPDFFNYINQHIINDYTINAIVADGYIDENTFVASSLIVTCLPNLGNKINNTTDNKDRTILSGPSNYNSTKSRMRNKRGTYKLKNSKIIEDPVKLIRHKKKIPLTPGVSSEQADTALVKVEMSEKMRLITKNNKFPNLNPGMGNYTSQLLNDYLNSEEYSIEKKSNVKISEIKTQTHFIASVERIFSDIFKATDPVSEKRYMVILDDYFTAKKNNEFTAMKQSPLYKALNDPRNKILAKVLERQTVKEYREGIEQNKEQRTFKGSTSVADRMLQNDKTNMKVKDLLINNPKAFNRLHDQIVEKMIDNSGEKKSKLKRLQAQANAPIEKGEVRLEGDKSPFYDSLYKSIDVEEAKSDNSVKAIIDGEISKFSFPSPNSKMNPGIGINTDSLSQTYLTSGYETKSASRSKDSTQKRNIGGTPSSDYIKNNFNDVFQNSPSRMPNKTRGR